MLLQFHFMQNAFVAGTLVALLAGVAGYFVVLRGQSFAAHMLSQVGFPGAAAGGLVPVSPVLGVIVFFAGAAVGLGGIGREVDAGHPLPTSPPRFPPSLSPGLLVLLLLPFV